MRSGCFLVLALASCHATAAPPLAAAASPVVALPSAAPVDTTRPEPPPSESALGPFSTTNASVKVVEIRRTDTSATEASVGVVLTIGRPDLAIDEPDNREGKQLTVDLPKPLQPRLLYMSPTDDVAPERGSMCDRPRFPHECALGRLRPADDERTRDALVKVTFEDGTYAAVPISVPIPRALAVPEVLEPQRSPAQGSPIAFAFRDVGADTYEIRISACHRYKNDGINPCLDSTSLVLTRRDGNLALQYGPESRRVDLATTDNEVHVRIHATLSYEESVEYEVTATKRGSLRGVATVSRSAASRTLTADPILTW